MAEPGYVDVRWIGGPYDGAQLPLTDLYLQAQMVDMPDPATATADGRDEPAIFTGPTHRYRLERDESAEGLIARHVPR